MKMVLICTYPGKKDKVIDLGVDRKSIGKILPDLEKNPPHLVKIEFQFNNRPAFTYIVSDLNHLRKIVPFISFSASTTTYNAPPTSIGFYDRERGLRVEFFGGQFRIYTNIRKS